MKKLRRSETYKLINTEPDNIKMAFSSFLSVFVHSYFRDCDGFTCEVLIVPASDSEASEPQFNAEGV